MTNTLRIATRKSPLALWQAEFVQAELTRLHPELTVELVPISTRGDKILDVALAKVGGKGLFVKELEIAMAAEQADLAVHSMKDVPMALPEGFELAVICQREMPYDAFVSHQFAHLDELPHGAVVGTSSLRRQAQLLAYRPDLTIKFLRGNVGTRLSKLDDGMYDAIILASAGLIRLGLEDRIRHHLDAGVSLPAVGQGAVGIEIRAGDGRVKSLLSGLSHSETTLRVTSERAMNRALNGGCQVPIAGFAEVHDGALVLEGRVGSADGQRLLIETQHRALPEDTGLHLSLAEELGQSVAEALLAQGAAELLSEL